MKGGGPVTSPLSSLPLKLLCLQLAECLLPCIFVLNKNVNLYLFLHVSVFLTHFAQLIAVKVLSQEEKQSIRKIETTQ